MIYVIVALLQIVFSVLKVFDVKWSYENKTVPLMVINFLLGGVWILATAIGVNSVIGGDWVMISVYIVSGGLGKWVAIKWFGNYNIRKNVYKAIKNKDPGK